MIKIYRFLSVLIIFFGAVLVFQSPVIYAQRLDTPDGETVIKKAVFTYDIYQFRIAATQNCIYASQLSNTNQWSQNKQLYMVPAGSLITDFTLKAGETGDRRTFSILLNNATVITFVFNTATFNIAGSPAIEAPPAGQIVQLRKVLLSNQLYLLMGAKVYYNKSDGQSWILDSAGLAGSTVSDINFDNSQNILAATSKGLFKQNFNTYNWSRISGFDSTATLACTVVFQHRNGRIYINANNRGAYTTYSSTNDGSTWSTDTVGIRSINITRFGDDGSGNIFGIYTQQTGYSALYCKKTDSTYWKKVDSNLTNPIGNSLRIYDIGGNNTIEAATTYGMYTSTDGANNWSATSAGILSEQIYGLRFIDANKIAVSTTLGIFTKEGTGSWRKRYPVNGFLSSRIIQSDGYSNLYTQEPTTGGGQQALQPKVLKSTDRGVTWSYDTLGISKVPGSNFNTPVFFVDEQGTQHIGMTASNNTPIRTYTKPMDSTWSIDTLGSGQTAPAQGQTKYMLAFGSDARTSLYSSNLLITGQTISSGTFLKRPLNGSTWSLDSTGLNGAAIYAMAVDSTGNLYAGSLSKGVVSSLFKKGTNSWQSISLPPASSADIKSMSTNTSGDLFVNFAPVLSGTVYKGVYRTNDKGATWEFAGLDSVNVRGLAGNGDDMYAYTIRGAYKLGSSVIKIPKMVLSTKIIDFDTVSQGLSRDKIVNISNTGNDTLRISNITSNNAAFKAQTTVIKVAPNGSVDLTLSFQPAVKGVVNGTLRITSNDFPDSILVKGEGINFKSPDMTLSSRIVDFKQVSQGAAKDTTVKITNNGLATLLITNITSNNTVFTITTRTFSIDPATSADLTIRFQPTANGIVNGRLRITSNLPNDSILVTGEGINFSAPKMVLSTKIIDFKQVSSGAFKDSTVKISNTGSDTLKITNITANNPVFSTLSRTFTIAPGKSADLICRFQPTTNGVINSSLRFTSNAPNDTILVTGEGINFAAPKMILSTRIIDFGNVEFGQSKDSSFKISNTGNDTLRISRFRLSSANFIVSAGAMNIAPGANAVISVTFTPTDTLQANGNVRISSNLPQDTVFFRGKGFIKGNSVDEPVNITEFNSIDIVPNPVTDNLNILFSISTDSDVSIKIFDISGIEIYSIPTKYFMKGSNSITLDMTNNNLKIAGSGTYFCKIITKRGTMTKPFVIAR